MQISGRRSCLVVFSLTLLIRPATPTDDNRDSPFSSAQKLSRAHFEFSLDLYKALVADLDPEENLSCSPYSVNVVLAMLFLGTSSSSDSSAQLRTALHFDNISYVSVHHAFKQVVDLLAGDDKYYSRKVRQANALFLAVDAPLSAPYERALAQFYRARVDRMDFRNADPTQTMGVINDWVGDVTDGLIPELLDAPPPQDARLILVNALAMDAKWMNPFDPNDTFDKGLFFLPGNRRVEVPMMSGRFTLPTGYSPELECRVLELPFTQRRISLFVLLPDHPQDGIKQLEANMTSDNIKMLFSTLEDRVVNVRIPRFRVASEARVEDALHTMGVVDLFNPETSDLRLMTPSKNIFLSSIAHKSVLEVTESGARGAAATSASLERVGTFGEHYFEVDHPFVFLVWDYYSGMLLLMGRVARPEQVVE